VKAWVISGGGARIVQAQLLIEEYLNKGGTLPKQLVGTSAGGLLAILIGTLGVDGSRRELMKIKRRSDIFSDQLKISKGLWDAKPLQGLIREVIKQKPKIPYHVCAYDLGAHKKTYFKHSDGWWHLSSSACIPGLVNPVDSYTDGGVVENVPLAFAIKLGATEIDLFMCSAKENRGVKHPKNVFDVVLFSLEAMRIEVAEADIKMCEAMNLLGHKHVDVNIHYPKKDLIGLLEFNKIREVLK
jgi:predicted acylesterase/phospholipase RssA